MATTIKEQVLRTQSRMSLLHFLYGIFRCCLEEDHMTALFIFNCFQQSVLEDHHESAIEQVLRITTKRFFGYKNPQRFADGYKSHML